MHTTNYIGFGNGICQCDYVTGTIDGDEVLVLQQTASSKTSITNMVEDIVSGLLAGPLSNVDATKLRVFEFYSPSLEPLRVWQEVTFAGVARRSPRQTVIQQLIEYIRPTEQPFVVWDAAWKPVNPTLEIQLAALDPALV